MMEHAQERRILSPTARRWSGARGLAAVALVVATGFPGCGGDGSASSGAQTLDVVEYFPLELGRYWVYFNADAQFITAVFTRTDTVVGFDVLVLGFYSGTDPEAAVEDSPLYEAYFASDPDQGVLWYGYKDYELGESSSFSPGVLFAGNEMVIGESVITATAASGQLTRYVTTLVARGIVETYYGTFEDAVEVTVGPEDGEQPKYFLARGFGLVKFDWKGTRYQLYDYGGGQGGGEE